MTALQLQKWVRKCPIFLRKSDIFRMEKGVSFECCFFVHVIMPKMEKKL